MLRRTVVTMLGKEQPSFLKKTISESQFDKLMNMDRVYRNLAMEKREYKRPWTFEKDMRGSIIHLNDHNPVKPLQAVGTVLDVSHNETHMDAWYVFQLKSF